MELLFLGTGAADWKYVPDEEMKSDMGRNIRRTTSLLIDNHILIDPAPAAFEFSQILGTDLKKLTDVFITHTHNDHFNSESLLNFAHASRNGITLWCHRGAAKFVPQDEKITVCTIEEYESHEANGFKFHSLAANHIVEGSNEQPLHYFFEIDEKTMLYGCDGGWFLARTVEFISAQKLDCVIFDATVGDYDGDFRLGTHNSIPMIRLIKAYFEKNGILKSGARLVLSHLARTLHTPIADTESAMSKEGFITAYDSMRILV